MPGARRSTAQMATSSREGSCGRVMADGVGTEFVPFDEEFDFFGQLRERKGKMGTRMRTRTSYMQRPKWKEFTCCCEPFSNALPFDFQHLR
ncbi:hypothetical protein ACJRO7_032519 [Eucalyptus globulus]|uniref:Uncharacterized protein n=1 Tax=Eucalyptus globulus TaxID=34317 RepID=A0ABD3JK45_EUCGL